jgi:hypothetical protein
MSDSGQRSRWARIRDQIIDRTSIGLPRSQRFMGLPWGSPTSGTWLRVGPTWLRLGPRQPGDDLPELPNLLDGRQDGSGN